jgi:hypothetical protein
MGTYWHDSVQLGRPKKSLGISRAGRRRGCIELRVVAIYIP